jgi:hypothetical protein
LENFIIFRTGTRPLPPPPERKKSENFGQTFSSTLVGPGSPRLRPVTSPMPSPVLGAECTRRRSRRLPGPRQSVGSRCAGTCISPSSCTRVSRLKRRPVGCRIVRWSRNCYGWRCRWYRSIRDRTSTRR